jgi:hypothetical protein
MEEVKVFDAIEFIAKIEGKCVEIPEEYRDQLPEKFRVLILYDKPKKATKFSKFAAKK